MRLIGPKAIIRKSAGPKDMTAAMKPKMIHATDKRTIIASKFLLEKSGEDGGGLPSRTLGVEPAPPASLSVEQAPSSKLPVRWTRRTLSKVSADGSRGSGETICGDSLGWMPRVDSNHD
jgi:hypothetical protein